MRAREFINRHSLIIGLILMFLYTWTIDLSNSAILPFHMPFAVTITLGWGFIFISLLMTVLTLGKNAAVALLKRFLIWRVGWKWLLAAVVLDPACIILGVALHAVLTRTPLNFDMVTAYQVFGASAPLPLLFLPFFLVDLITNGEEMGWRGYVLPRLQAKYSALSAALIIGLVWGFWHLPKFLVHFNTALFPWFMLHIMAFAVILTWLYNSTNGSLLITAVCHALSNTVAVFMPMATMVSGEETGSYIVYVLLESVVAGVVIAAAGSARLSRTETMQVQD